MTEKQNKVMPLGGYHLLPQVPVMGRNVRTAQSKSSVKMTVNSLLTYDDTMLHLDGDSKVIKMSENCNSVVVENAISEENKVIIEPVMTNGIDPETNNSHTVTLEVTDSCPKEVEPSSPMKKKRGRKKKIENRKSPSLEAPSSELNASNPSIDTSTINTSLKETINDGVSDHVLDTFIASDVEMLHLKKQEESPLEMKPKSKRGRKKKIENMQSPSLEVPSLELNASNQSIDASFINTSLKETIHNGGSDHVIDTFSASAGNSDQGASPPEMKPKSKRGRKKKIKDTNALSVLESNAVNQCVETSAMDASLKESVDAADSNHVFDSSDVEMVHSKEPEITGSESKAIDALPVKKTRGRKKKIIATTPILQKDTNDSLNISDVEVLSPSKTKCESSETSQREQTADGVHNSNPLFSRSSPRVVMIMPTQVLSESQLEKLKSMDSTSFNLQHPLLWNEGDMLWARISGHPYWPCMISKCPFTSMMTRIKAGSHLLRSYHVQFFGDDCERGWVNEASLMAFKGRADFLEKARLEGLKPAKKGKSKNSFIIKNTRSIAWNIGVDEAEGAFSHSLKERLVRYTFEYIFIDNIKTSLSTLPSASSTPITSGKRKRTDTPNRISEQSKAKKQKRDMSLSDEKCCLTSPKSSKQSRLSASLSKKSFSSPSPSSGKRLIKPTKKIVESLLQEQSGDQDTIILKSSPDQVKKRGRPRKFSELVPSSQDSQISVITEAEKDSCISAPDSKSKKEVAASARKMSQDSDSSSEVIKRVKKCEPYELEIFKLHTTAKIEKENICSVCEKNGDLLECVGTCGQYFHASCCSPDHQLSADFKCDECTSGIHSCFSCKKVDTSTKKCSVSQCGKYYHEECIKKLRFARVISESKGFVCPLHICSTCAVENVRNPKATKGRLYRCTRCPVAFHFGDFCLSAGSQNLGSVYIVCSDHFQRNKSLSQHSHVNITWCFSCSKGGTLLCCDNCPASYHAECVKVEKTPDEAWFCEDCVAGQKLLYGSIVWVKIGNYRWWPGEICHPRHVPLNIQEKAHQVGEFPIRFFGSHDYYWIHRGRVFLFEEGDKASKDSSSKGLFKAYTKGVAEATEAFKLWKAAKTKKEEQEQERNDKKPSQFKFVKNNVPIGSVQIYKAELSEIPHCECTENQEEPCSSDCLNRMVMYECHPAVCPAKDKCNNQRFQKRLHARCEPFRAEGRGWGLRTLEDLKKGQFVIEYAGDLIDEEECKRRIKHSHEDNVTNFYMLTMDKNRIIDAGPKGNYSRFMNHSCCPNMETQKWMVNGDIRVGLFALADVPAGTELVFNYNLECIGNEKRACACGAENCSGFLGVRPKTAAAMANEKKVKELKKKRKKKKFDQKKDYEDVCFRCGEGGELVMCDRTKCPKVYHLQCLKLTKPPSGKWACPWHHCDECGRNATSLCSECPNSFCSIHAAGNIETFADCLVCVDHDELLEELSKSIQNDMGSLNENETKPNAHLAITSNLGEACGVSSDQTESFANNDSIIINGESQDPPPVELHKDAALGCGDMISSGKYANRSRNTCTTRQPGLSRKAGGAGSSSIHMTKGNNKIKQSSSKSTPDNSSCKYPAIQGILQKSEHIKESDDNDSVSDLVIDIP